MISQFRRNLQADYTDRLIKIATGNAQMPRTVRQQSIYQLEQIKTKLDSTGLVVPSDPSPRALAELQQRDYALKGKIIHEAGIQIE